jgi:serine/threonine-protein kinase
VLLGYRIEGLAGRGGMGVVYRATQLRLKRTVALKLLAPELAQDERFRERFLRESELAASIDHPHIVTVHDAGETDDGLLYLAMRWIDGTDLKRLLAAQGPLDPSRALAILTQVADALDTAHEHGLVHRDVKPANILLEQRRGADHAYLSDFGLAKSEASASGLTGTGEFLGTVDYIAPEQIRSEPADSRADIYSLGCVLHETLTGQPPYPRDTPLGTAWAHVQDPIPKPSTTHPDLPQALDTVITTALAKTPAHRYPSCGALAQATREALELAPELPPAAPPPGRSKHRQRAWIAAALLIGGGALAAALALLLVNRNEPTAREPAAAPAAAHQPSTGTGTARPSEISLVHIDPAANNLAGEAPLASGQSLGGGAINPPSIAAGEGAVWSLLRFGGAVYKVSPSRLTTIASIPVAGVPGAGVASIALGSGSVWVDGGIIESGSAAKLQVTRIDPTANRVVTTIETSAICCGPLAFGEGALWVEDTSSGSTLRIDPATNRVVATVSIAGEDIAVGEGSVWVLDTLAGTLTPIDPGTNTAGSPIPLSGTPIAIAVGDGAVWVLDAADAVSKIPVDRRGGIDTVAVGERPRDIAFGEKAVWVANAGDATISRIDPETADVEETIDVDGSPDALAVGEGGVWVVVEPA